ncbi:hypothetical protein I3842_03G046600 [Carya illinoinensis]|uniref:DUF7950 domain-containing protein n=1 Tax=Carya illinoinensis TaxID=32201 RepID=A0A922JTL4_CARIL|nr:hypothetical protein I3842_03G046600 [Carya illinoinensis]
MEGGAGRCMKSYAVGVQDKVIMNRIMPRFRPIAPKPATGGSGSGGSATDNKDMFMKKGRTKRKYVRVRKNNPGTRPKKSTAEGEMKEYKDGLNKKVVTLQLLPQNSERNESPESGSGCSSDLTETIKNCQGIGVPPMCLNFNKAVRNDLDRTVVMRQMRGVMESWVTVESVTDTCMDVRRLGCTDAERMRNLAEDTCPGFVSDDSNRVFWVNGAFKKMMSRRNDGLSPEIITVWLVAKEKLPYLYTAFTCQVKLQYTRGKDSFTQILPCDAWKMDGGGFAWRLDVEAALSLGR